MLHWPKIEEKTEQTFVVSLFAHQHKYTIADLYVLPITLDKWNKAGNIRKVHSTRLPSPDQIWIRW